MASDWIAAAVSGGSAVTASAVALYGTARVTAASKSRDRAGVHEEWIREHRKDAYLGLLHFAERVGACVQGIRPAADPTASYTLPELLRPEAHGTTRVPVVAFGSNHVRQQVDEWLGVVVRVAFTADAIASGEGQWKQLSQLRAEERQARQALEDYVSLEVQSLREVVHGDAQGSAGAG
jgi:hypothetical protein